LIFNIDDTDAKYNLLALRSNLLTSITQMMPDLKFDYPDAFKRWKSYLDVFDVTQSIPALPEIQNEQVKYYVAGRSILNQYYSIKSQEDRLSDHRIYAPFSGIVTASNVSPGSWYPREQTWDRSSIHLHLNWLLPLHYLT
jgi:membrane fusion protein (multidrug efflux system)